MQTRRSWLIMAGVAVLATVLSHQANGAKEASLNDRLRAGLKARTKAEFAFIDRVVVLVDKGVLPLPIVDRAFFWSRKKAKKKGGIYEKRPMIYFEPALIWMAKKVKIDIQPM